MVKKHTLFQKAVGNNPEEVQQELQKLQFTYNAHINTLVAKSCQGKTGKEFKRCFKEHSELIGDLYSLQDYYSDNYNASRNQDPTFGKSLKIIKKILNSKD